MKIPEGFIEVTGRGTLRSILIRVDDIQSINTMWSCSSAEEAKALAHKIATEDPEGEPWNITPPEDAEWWSCITTSGGNFNVVETLEEITKRMLYA